MKNITWRQITVGHQKPYYTANHGKFNAEIRNHGANFSITINENSIVEGTGNGFFNPPIAKYAGLIKTHYGSSATTCKNYFRKFLKSADKALTTKI